MSTQTGTIVTEAPVESRCFQESNCSNYAQKKTPKNVCRPLHCACVRARVSVCVCECVLSSLCTTKLSSIFMATTLHVCAF